MSRRAMLMLASYALGHMIVDGACGATVAVVSTHAPAGAALAWWLVVAYSVIAFAVQAPLGLVVDRLGLSRRAGALGCLLTAAAVPIAAHWPMLAVGVAGVGNALFHVSTGGIVLRLTPGLAAAPGILVAPGAIGLAVGTWFGRSDAFTTWPLVVLAAAMAIAFCVRPPEGESKERDETSETGGLFECVLVLLCFAITVRSLLGLTLGAMWKADPSFGLTLACLAAAGKAAGGILADRFGWIRVSLLAVLIAAPLTSFGSEAAPLVAVGTFLFQMGMPVTLAAIARMYPRLPSFAFGLASLALLVGAVPTFVGSQSVLAVPWLLFILPFASAGSLLTALILLPRALGASLPTDHATPAR